MPTNYRFPAKNSDGTASQYYNDIEDVFVNKEYFLEKGLWMQGSNDFRIINGLSGGPITTPVQNWTNKKWRQVSGSVQDYIGAVTYDGRMWMWGNNADGELGLNDIVHRSSPTQVGSGTNWQCISTYVAGFTNAIKTDGTLWTWGYNSEGQLGLSDTIHRSSPVQVGTLTNWKYIPLVSYQACAIKTDGTLWTWGRSAAGELGLNDQVNRSSPVQVGTDTNWRSVVRAVIATVAIKTDGTIWSWGSDVNGTTGTGFTNFTPIQIGTLNNWKSVTAGYYAVVATKTDGTLWAWGSNGSGELGLGDTTNRSSPVQVGTLTNWKTPYCNIGQSSAIKTDGTLWAWGDNGNGRLGLGDTTARSSPVQVTSISGPWRQAGFTFTMGYGLRIDEY
jgi:alpha-tubulin suppressor-like RCC1 family protein